MSRSLGTTLCSRRSFRPIRWSKAASFEKQAYYEACSLEIFTFDYLISKAYTTLKRICLTVLTALKARIARL